MSPRPRKSKKDEGAGAAGGGGGGGDADAAGAAGEPSPPVDTMNGTLCTRMAEHMTLIKDMPVFKDITTTAALDIGNGGYQKPYNAADFKLSMTTGLYKCGFNIFMVNFNWSPTPGVPIAEARVDMFMEYYFKEPAVVPFDLVIRVPSLDFDPMTHLTGLQCITPEEVKMAFVKAIVRDKDDTGALDLWKNMR